MALFAAARRAAASAAPLILRASASSGAHRGAALLRPLAASAARPQPRAMPFSSAPATRPSSDAELLSVIDSEIKYAEDCDDHDRVEEIPDNFPFKITDEKGMNAITLKRTYHGEQIEVLAQMPSLVTGDEPDHDRDAEGKGEEGDGDGDEDQSEKPPQSSIPLTVTITKGDGPILEFTCTAYPDEVLIDSLSVRQPSGNDEIDLIAYEGPDFNDLDENLQRAFHKYLELRGISPLTTNFLHEYMINKDSREYLLWLRKLKDFFRQ
ncbi:hypothetical protein PVAP13_5NG097000 [Panicum virgatum]|uniref:Mitochondrial glycoprotein family protein n=1 Tax=Panicum virgatum TaxID=38727 RepID=A0A8T0RPA9_PANVG|nr:hypothetical protein PVAP13_5NG097000 [Panicum virgatum]